MAAPSPEDEDKRRQGTEYMKYTGMAFQMAATIAIGILLGRFLDRQMHSKQPYFTALFAMVFTGVAIYLAIKDFLKKKP
ncbi:MAG: AtpZ/AtpI family protein [Saprospiraceae bacterium]|nr:AtpZ/AtpI family protein [Saprospiraceae bacterium]